MSERRPIVPSISSRGEADSPDAEQLDAGGLQSARLLDLVRLLARAAARDLRVTDYRAAAQHFSNASKPNV